MKIPLHIKKKKQTEEKLLLFVSNFKE